MVYGSSCNIVVCVNTDIAWKRQFDNKNHADIDGAITTEHICLAAAEQGLGTCWVCNFDVAMCKENLDLEAYIQPIANNSHWLSNQQRTSTIYEKGN
jgi:nitroreductase